MYPKELTIVVPVWNRASLVRRTLDSISASTHHGFELLIVDNCSTDDSLSVCEQWAWEHRDDGFPIRVLSEQRHGASAARNRGLMECRTEFIYFFDSDDLFSADFVATVLPLLTQDLDVLCVPVRQKVNGLVQTRAYEAKGDIHVHLLNSMLCTPSMVLRADYLRRIGSWNEELSTWDDWELGVRVLLAAPRLQWFTERAFHIFYVHPESQTGASFSATLPQITKAMLVVISELQNAEIPSKEERRKTQRALYYRTCIMAGKLACEKSREGAQTFLAMAANCAVSIGVLRRWCGAVLRIYTAHGGRGAWRIALWLC
ncbi:MAG: glycosyltransferase family 2 protein [Bacteroidaceae bacterium]|nr:glycosyltransferase family 2 protein [Bacteroidaceae bacterium]